MPLVDRPDPTIFSDSLADALGRQGLPEEWLGLDAADRARVLAQLTASAAVHRPGTVTIDHDVRTTTDGARRMAFVIINDDMPFLVDSIANTFVAHGLDIHCLLHPVIAHGAQRLSVIYLECARADARRRAALVAELGAVLRDVRAAADDWQPMLSALAATRQALEHAHPDRLADARESSAFLDWLADDAFIFLGACWHAGQSGAWQTDAESALGLMRGPDAETLRDDMRRLLPDPDVMAAGAIHIVRANRCATVHRRALFDVINCVGRDAQGRISGVQQFIGLFSSQALTAPLTAVPLLRDKLATVQQILGYPARGHHSRALAHVLQSLPRDELFQRPADDLATLAQGLLSLDARPRPRLFLRRAVSARQTSALIFLPRDRYDSGVRLRVSAVLTDHLAARVLLNDVRLDDSPLARLYFLLETERQGDEAALNQALDTLVRGWDEAVELALAALVPRTRALRLALSCDHAFSAAYREAFTPQEAAEDLLRFDAITQPSGRAIRLYRKPGDASQQLRLKVYQRDALLPLSEAVPILEAFGFRVISEYPHAIGPAAQGWIHDFLLDCGTCGAILSDLNLTWLETELAQVLTGMAESDAFNALVTGAGLTVRQTGWLRAFFRYLRQIDLSYSVQTIVDVLRRNAAVTVDLVHLFTARHDPQLADRTTQYAAIAARLDAALATITAIDDDRIIRLFRALIEATLRTNAFVPNGPEALALKFDCARIPGMPQPVPACEIWVHSARVEAVHLRGGPVARGGLRWSDRRDDFRTEVLGLMKAQMVKNAVIVPTGAKGGFYAKALPNPADRAAWLAEGQAAYRIFIRALLSLTDNRVDGRIVPPPHVVRHDGDDPYLVVAADKGTASFSDIANAISIEQGFWLGDAFASGGSHGYDHKAMGITARGAWISVTDHFHAQAIDIARGPVRVAGVGDMSGDVFGNAMLLSQAIRLVAAFDHRHIFLDPAPDPVAAWTERQRLFRLKGSSWADYDPALISAGGGVFPRSQKNIALSPEVRALLAIDADSLSAADLMAAILRAPVDLLWFGGIGTYVKAASESHADVGDRANDAIRVDAETLRARVIGEGANLGVTQAGRIAFARAGGRINADFIDNSAGVDCSDHEVNIKIALGRPLADGRMTPVMRDQMLKAMTDDVARLVLCNNRLQSQALSLAEHSAARDLDRHERLIAQLEAEGRLNRKTALLPDKAALAARRAAGTGLTRPELAMLMAHAKIALRHALTDLPLLDDPLLRSDLHAAFPPALASAYPDALDDHPLRRTLTATLLANEMVNRCGLTFAFDLASARDTTLAHVASCYVAARTLLDMPALWDHIMAADTSHAVCCTILAQAADGLRLHIDDFLRVTTPDVLPSTIVPVIAPSVSAIAGDLDRLLLRIQRQRLDDMAADLAAQAVPTALAAPVLRLFALDGVIGVAALAAYAGYDPVNTAETYAHVGQRLGLDWLMAATAQLVPADLWTQRLRDRLLRDGEDLRLDLIARVAATASLPLPVLQAWLEETAIKREPYARLLVEAQGGPDAPDFAMMAQLMATLRDLLPPTRQGALSNGWRSSAQRDKVES